MLDVASLSFKFVSLGLRSLIFEKEMLWVYDPATN
jgi:hypothetical protein